MATINIDSLDATPSFSGGLGGGPRLRQPRAAAAPQIPLDDIDQNAPPQDNESPIPGWIKNSALVPDINEPPPKGCAQPAPSCLFEPLKYCQPDLLLNGFCSFHYQNMFNIKLDQSSSYTCQLPNKTFVKSDKLRMLTNIPRAFTQTLTPVFPCAEEYSDMPNMQDMHLALFYENNEAERIKGNVTMIAEHVKFLHRIWALFSNTPKSSFYPGDDVILIHYSNWAQYVKSTTLQKRCDLRLVREVNGNLQFFDLNKCSTITQCVARCFELPYGILPTGQIIGGIPAYSFSYHRHLCLDDTKATNGTLYQNGKNAIGDPCTIAMSRVDNGTNDYAYLTKGFKPALEICGPATLDKREFVADVRPVQM